MIFVGPPMMGPPPMMYVPPMRMHPGMNLNLDININQRPADFPVVTPSYVQGRCIFFYSFQNGCSSPCVFFWRYTLFYDNKNNNKNK